MMQPPSRNLGRSVSDGTTKPANYRRFSCSISNPLLLSAKDQKKLRSRIADLESRVYQAQRELKNLKALLPSNSRNLRSRQEVEAAAREQNVLLRNQLSEAKMKLSSAETRQEESALKLSELSRKLEASRDDVGDLNDKLEAAEGAKGVIEEEMKKLKLQTQQWQVAAEAAAQLLLTDHNGASGDLEQQHRDSIGEDFGVIFEVKDDFGEVYRRGFGFRVFGDLWKMKGLK